MLQDPLGSEQDDDDVGHVHGTRGQALARAASCSGTRAARVAGRRPDPCALKERGGGTEKNPEGRKT